FDPGWERGHRRVFYAVEGRATLPGRLAIDFVKLDGGGRIAEGDPDVIRGAYGYGEPVLAVADAVVAAVRDGYPEAGRVSENGQHPLSKGSGNYVVLDLGDGRDAVYEHLRPGSGRGAGRCWARSAWAAAAAGRSCISTSPMCHRRSAARACRSRWSGSNCSAATTISMRSAARRGCGWSRCCGRASARRTTRWCGSRTERAQRGGTTGTGIASTGTVGMSSSSSR